MTDQKRGATRATVDTPQDHSTPNVDPPAPHRPTGVDRQKTGLANQSFSPPADGSMDEHYAAGGNPGDPATAYNPHPT